MENNANHASKGPQSHDLNTIKNLKKDQSRADHARWPKNITELEVNMNENPWNKNGKTQKAFYVCMPLYTLKDIETQQS